MGKKKSNYIGILDIIKAKLIESGTTYFKKNLDKTKKQVFNMIEKNLERKIKYEIKFFLLKLFSVLILVISLLFLSYGFLELILIFFSLPIFLTNILFGLFLFILGFIIFLIYN